MKLNLTIVADYLKNVEILVRKTDKPFRFPLCTVRFLRLEEAVTEDYLYLTTPENLPWDQKDAALSIICIGKGSDQETNWEFLYVHANTDRDALLNQLLDCFVRFADWDQRLMKACYGGASLHELGTIALEVFQNCISCWDAQERMLFVCYYSENAELPFLYPQNENDYLDEDMKKILDQTPVYQQALQKREPALYPVGTYATTTLYYNLFDHDVHLAHLGIEPYDREFLPSDYSLIQHFGNYVKLALIKYNSLRVGGSRKFDEILYQYLKQGYFAKKEAEKELRKYGWKLGDSYRCMLLCFSEDDVAAVSLYGCMIYLMNLYSDLYIYKMEERLLVIFHQQSLDRDILRMEHLLYFLDKNDAYAGVSNAFQGFEQLALYYQQAELTLEAGLKHAKGKRLHQFDELALDILIENGIGALPLSLYFTSALWALVRYDREKNAELIKTLRMYLNCNFHAAQTFAALHIHKTTFAYRMERIKKISGFDLKDYRVRLYLMMLFEYWTE